MSEYFVERKWGTWLVLAMQPGYKVKKLKVNPGQSLSKQYHTHRDEYWVVLEGQGELVLDTSRLGPEPTMLLDRDDFITKHDLKKGSFIKVHKQVIHKLTNTGDVPLVIIETQVGDICEEGDIIRLD